MPTLVLPEKVAAPVGPTITIPMRGGQIPFTSLFRQDAGGFGWSFRVNSEFLYPRFAYVDETTPYNLSVRDAGSGNEDISVAGCTDLIHGTSITFPFGGTDSDPFFWFGGAGMNITDNEWWVSRGGSTGNFVGSGGQQYRGIQMTLNLIAFPQNANTTGFISVTDTQFGGDDYTPFPFCVASISLIAQFSELWNLTAENTIKLNNGDLLIPGDYDYYDFKTNAQKDPAGTRNRWQAVRYHQSLDQYEMFSLVNLASAAFPVPGPSALYRLLAYNQETLGNELALVFAIGEAFSGGGGLATQQTVYCQTTPSPAFSCGIVTALDGLPPISVTNGPDVATLDDLFTPVLDGLNLPFCVIQGCPEGFLVYNYFDAFTFYIVNREWTSYQKYEIEKADTLACTADQNIGSLRGDIKWVAPGNYILLVDQGTTTLNRLRPGAPSVSWGGCIHEGGTGEGGGGGPAGPPVNGPPFDQAVQNHVSVNITINPSALDVDLNNPEPQE